MKIYTIGFTKKSAKEFFSILKKNNIKTILDVRLNNNSQLFGFAKYPDLPFFLKELCDINYIHDTDFAPTKDLLKDYKSKNINWETYEHEFNNIIIKRNICEKIKKLDLDRLCLLCSEKEPDFCHRRLIAEYIKEMYEGVEIIHL